MIAEGEQDNADLWRKINNVDESISHLVSARIVQFAKQHGATILVFLSTWAISSQRRASTADEAIANGHSG